MKIVQLGHGFLGEAIARRLAQSETDSLTIISRGRTAGDLPPGATLIRADLSDLPPRLPAMENAGCLIIAAGPSSPRSTDPSRLDGVFLRPLAELIARATGQGMRLVYLSSGGTIYSEPSARKPVNEDFAVSPRSDYARYHSTMEGLVRGHAERAGTGATILRVATAYGPGQQRRVRHGFVVYAIRQALRRQSVEIWGAGDTVRDYVFVQDVAEAVERAVRRTGPPIHVNIATGIGRSLKGVVSDLRSVLDLNVETVQRGNADGPSYSVLDPARASSVLGWSPRTTWHEGLKKTVRWVERHLNELAD